MLSCILPNFQNLGFVYQKTVVANNADSAMISTRIIDYFGKGMNYEITMENQRRLAVGDNCFWDNPPCSPGVYWR